MILPIIENNNLNIIDVTLRDGGHQVNFNWPIEYAIKHIDEISKTPSVNYIELAYWKQTAKSINPFYCMDENFLDKITSSRNYSKLGIMVDCHYCSECSSDYPSAENFGIGLVRLCSRSEDIDKASKLAEKIKKRTGAKLSLNFFNISNYSQIELEKCIYQAYNVGADFIYFADTHGTLDLLNDFEKYKELAHMINEFNIIPGFHLHDHSGKAFLNYRLLPYLGFGSTDVSLCGMGKGDGNLKLEFVVPVSENPKIFNLIEENRDLLIMKPSSYGIISSYYSITDYYALQAQKGNISPSEFFNLAKKINGLDKDNYNKEALV